jgi:uncharacterized membrane protein YbhN (UPF0104 family)
MSSKPARRQLLRVAGTLASLGLLAYLVSRQGWQTIWDSIRQISPERFLLAFLLMFLSRLAVTARWTSLLWLSGLRLPAWEILRVTFAGMFASHFLPTSVGGDIIRLAWTVRVQGDRPKYASSVAVDRLVGLAGMAMLLPLGIAQVLSAGVLSSAARIAPLAAASSDRLMDRVGRALRQVAELVRGWLTNPRALLTAFAFTWIHMALWLASIWVFFQGLGEPLRYWQVAGLYSLVYVISLFPFSIHSLGVAEVSAGLIYSSVGGVAVSSALTVALLLRTTEILASLPGVLSLPPLLALRRAEAKREPGELLEGASDA